VRISHDTLRLVRGLFETSELEAVKVKGIEQPLRSYLVERARPHTFRNPTRGIEGMVTRMVGRDAELAALGEALAHAALERTLVAVTVVGEPGIGKSRLMAEFRAGLEDTDQPCCLLLARAHPRSALHPYSLVRDLFAWHLRISDSDSPEAARDKLLRSFAPLFANEGEAPVHALGHLIGLDFSGSPHVQELLTDEARLRETAFAAASLALRRIAETRMAAVVVVIDDLHWADSGSMDLARHLLAHDRDMPMLCVFLSRPTLFEREPGWTEGDAAHRRIDVRPLDKADSRELAESLLQHIRDVPEALRAIVTGGAEGNPFYMEELVKMLIDDGVIVVDREGWRVLAERLQSAKVPATLTGVLQARLDALPPPERVALQQAAILGHVFWDQALAAVDPAAVGMLPALLHRHLVVPRDERPGADSGEYTFEHQVLQQVTYDSVLKAPRLQGHASAGAFWSARAEVATALQVNPAACRALAEAHDHCSRSDPRAFAVWFDAQYSNYLGAYVGHILRPLAQSVLQMCEQHHGPDHVETARALTNLIRLKLQQRDAEGAEPLLQHALAIQRRQLGDDHPDAARTLAVLGGYHQARGDLRSAEPFFRQALAIRERVLGSENPLTLGTMDNLAAALIELGRLDEAEALLRRVLGAREGNLGAAHPDTARAMTALAEIIAKRGSLGEAESVLRRALAVQERVLGGEHPDTGLTLWHLAETLRQAGRFDDAEPLARRMLEVFEKAFGDGHEWTAWGLSTLAEVRLPQGGAAEAAALAGRAQAIFERHFGAQHAQVAAMLVVRARAALTKGKPERAVPMLERALAITSAQAGDTLATRSSAEALLDHARRKASLSGQNM
jgi:tetratricopeptide (TPR) repeat protein